MESVSTEGVTIKVEPKETISVATKLFVSEEGVLCGNEKLEPQEHPFITADIKNKEDSDNVDVKFEHKFLHGENEGEDTIFVSEGSALYTGSEPIKEDRESAPESSDTKCFVDVKFEEEFLHDENVSVGTNLFSKDSALYTGSKPIKEENKSAPKSSDTKRRQEGCDDDNCKRRKLESDPEPASLTKEEVQTTDDGHEQSGQALTPSPGHPRAPSPSPRLASHEVVDTQAHGEGSEESDESDGGTPPSAPSAKPPASKKKRTYSILPEEKEMAVAEWYREHELLYNKKLRAYRDRERKDIAYRQMAAEINVTVECLQKWLENMRTRFAKLILLKSGQETKSLTEREQWIKETFSFLRPHIVRCHTHKSKVYKQADPTTETPVDAEEEAADDPSSPTLPETQPDKGDSSQVPGGPPPTTQKSSGSSSATARRRSSKTGAEGPNPDVYDKINITASIADPVRYGAIKKKKLTRVILSDETEDMLAEWVKDTPMLYMKRSKAYKDTRRKLCAYDEKAATLGVDVSGTNLAHWVRNMRSRYSKLSDIKSGSGTPVTFEGKPLSERDAWIMENFAFLKGHISRVKTKVTAKFPNPTVDVSPDVDVEVIGDDESDGEDTAMPPPTNTTPTGRSSSQKKRRKSAEAVSPVELSATREALLEDMSRLVTSMAVKETKYAQFVGYLEQQLERLPDAVGEALARRIMQQVLQARDEVSLSTAPQMAIPPNHQDPRNWTSHHQAPRS